MGSVFCSAGCRVQGAGGRPTCLTGRTGVFIFSLRFLATVLDTMRLYDKLYAGAKYHAKH